MHGVIGYDSKQGFSDHAIDIALVSPCLIVLRSQYLGLFHFAAATILLVTGLILSNLLSFLRCTLLHIRTTRYVAPLYFEKGGRCQEINCFGIVKKLVSRAERLNGGGSAGESRGSVYLWTACKSIRICMYVRMDVRDAVMHCIELRALDCRRTGVRG